MARGPKPRSTEVKRAEGVFAKDPQRENKSEPKPLRHAPPKPEAIELDPVASEKWDSLCIILDQLGLLANSDAELMELFCITWSQYRELLETIRESGYVAYDDKGNMKRNPLMIEYRNAADLLRRLVAEFGLTPSSRSRLVANKVEEESDFQKWLKKRANLN